MPKTNIVNEYIQWLKSTVNHSLYRCRGCNFSQGHQIIFCPKCGGEMIHKVNEPYTVSFLEHSDLGFYKSKFQDLMDEYVSYAEWDKIVTSIKEQLNLEESK